MTEAKELANQIIEEMNLYLWFKNDWSFLTPLQKTKLTSKIEELCMFALNAKSNDEKLILLNKLDNFLQIERNENASSSKHS